MQLQHLLRLFHGGLPDVFRLFETLHGNITQLLGYRRHVLVHEQKGPFARNMDCIESLVLKIGDRECVFWCLCVCARACACNMEHPVAMAQGKGGTRRVCVCVCVRARARALTLSSWRYCSLSAARSLCIDMICLRSTAISSLAKLSSCMLPLSSRTRQFSAKRSCASGTRCQVEIRGQRGEGDSVNKRGQCAHGGFIEPLANTSYNRKSKRSA